MSDSGGNGGSTVMQRLLAEHYMHESSGQAPPTPSHAYGQAINSGQMMRSPSEPDIAYGRLEARLNPFDDGRSFNSSDNIELRPDATQHGHAPHLLTPLSDGGPAARLDALCRSTLEKPNNQNYNNYKPVNPLVRDHPFGKDITVAMSTTELPKSSENGSPHPTPKKRSAAQEVLDRLRVEFQQNRRGEYNTGSTAPRPPPPSYHEAQIEVEQTKTLEHPNQGPFVGTPNLSPRYRLQENAGVKHVTGSRSFPSADSGQSVVTNQPSMQLNGHPKSNSGGDEYLYTDRHSNNARRGIRAKKNKNGVARSSSLHQNKDSSCRAPLNSLDEQRASDDINNSPLDPMSDSRSSGRSFGIQNAAKDSSQTKHSSSRSAPMQNSSKENKSEQRRFSIQGSAITNVPADDLTAQFSSVNQSQNSDVEKHQVMPQTPTASQAPYLRGPSGPHGPPPHGSFYPGMPAHALVGQTPPTSENIPSTHTPLMTALSGHSPPRPPPPPYPKSFMGVDPALGQGPEVNEVGSWNPQRPNSLALGNFSKKKGSNNSSSQNSPGLTSPSAPFKTPMRGTPFYSAQKESQFNAQNAQMYLGNNHVTNNSPHQRQTSNGSNSFLRRSGSGNSGRTANMATASSSSSSTVTAVSTPSYPDVPAFVDPGVRSPATPFNMHSVVPQNNHAQSYAQENYGSGNGVSKSDSINSTTSTASSGGRSYQRKRNSSSKSSYGNTSGSGSSSNSGSRPNSNADLTDRLDLENENLHNRLDAALQKLRKYETIEMDLIRINQNHQALQLSANKREQLEKEMQHQLTAKLQRVEHERDSFESQVISLTEQLKTMNMTSSRDESSRENGLLEIYEAKNRKLAEKERQLEEELEECRERISEQTVDIELLTSSLHKAKSTNSILKDKLLQQSKVDSYTEQLSEHLVSLQKIVDERQEIESDLRDRLRRQLGQRPLKSTSSNDEGISEMDTMEGPSNNSVDMYNNREGQMLGAKAEMLKWQHRYLEHGLLQHVQSNGSDRSESMRVYKALRNHRHALSDPGFDKISLRKNFLPYMEGPSDLPLCGFPNDNDLVDCRDREKKCRDLESNSYCTETDATRTDCACQTPDESWFLGDMPTDADGCGKVLEDSTSNSNEVRARGVQTGTSAGNMVEADSPSEGYHSQQSSGSPTPNTEKSSIHFPMPGECAASFTSSREIQIGAFRRNRSADVLTSLDV